MITTEVVIKPHKRSVAAVVKELKFLCFPYNVVQLIILLKATEDHKMGIFITIIIISIVQRDHIEHCLF